MINDHTDFVLSRKHVLTISCLLAAIVICGVLLLEREPAHHGRSLSDWYEQWYKAYARGDHLQQHEALHAMREMGTNAIPYALNTISEPFSMQLYSLSTRPLLNRLQLNKKAELRKFASAQLFYALGSECTPWIPNLLRLMNETPHDEVRVRATFCLSAIGDAALPEITNIVGKPTDPSWADFVHHLKKPELHLESTRAAVFPLLVDFSGNEDPDVSSRSLAALGAFRMKPQVVIPILTNAWGHTNAKVRAAAVSALGCLNEVSIPEMALSDSEYLVRNAATNALQMIRTNSIAHPE